MSICRCNFDWRESATHPLQEQELALTRQVYKLCGFYSGQVEISQLTNNPLLSLKLDQLLSAVFFVSGQSRGVVDTKGKFLAPNLSNFELHSSLNAAFSIFENWPIRFNQFLEWRREQRRKLKLGTGLKNDLGKLYKCLYKEFSDKSFNFMRKAFEEYVQLSWDGGCTSQVGKRSRAALRSKKYISRNEARHRLHIKIATLHYFVDIGKLNAVFLKERCIDR